MLKTFWQLLDKLIYKVLLASVDIMPPRLIKMVAFFYTDARIRKIYLKKLGIIMDEGTYTNIGFSVTVNDDFSPCVYIGKNVSIAPYVTLIPNSSPNNSDLLKSMDYVNTNLIHENTVITIEDDCWLGTGCIILPGITMKKGTILGAGSVLTQDTEEFSVYAGVPAKKIRSIKN